MPYTSYKPKSLVDTGFGRIIDLQIKVLRRNGIEDITVVTGYQSDAFDLLDVTYHHNPDYQSTNMLYSLMSTELNYDSDVIISYGDIIYTDDVISELLKSNSKFNVVVDIDWRRLWEIRMEDPTGDVESLTIENNSIVSIGQKINSLSEVEAQYIGLLKLRRDSLKEFISSYVELQNANSDMTNFNNMYITDFLQHLIIKGERLEPVFIKGGWLEYDTTTDLSNYQSSDYSLSVLKNITEASD